MPRPNRDVIDFVVRLPRPIHQALRLAAAARHLTMADVVREAVVQALSAQHPTVPTH